MRLFDLSKKELEIIMDEAIYTSGQGKKLVAVRPDRVDFGSSTLPTRSITAVEIRVSNLAFSAVLLLTSLLFFSQSLPWIGYLFLFGTFLIAATTLVGRVCKVVVRADGKQYKVEEGYPKQMGKLKDAIGSVMSDRP